MKIGSRNRISTGNQQTRKGLKQNCTCIDLSSGVISRVANREKYLEVIFFSAQPFVGGRSPPTIPLYFNQASYPRIGTIPNLHLHIFSQIWKILIFLYGEFESDPTSKSGFNHSLQVTNVQFCHIFLWKNVSFFSRFGCYYLEMTFDVRSVVIQT